MTVESNETAPTGPPWRLALALAAVLAVIALVRLLGTENAPTDPVEAGTGITVTVEQQRPDSDPLLVEVTLVPDATVFDATRAAGNEGGNVWASEWQGKGEMALLVSLGGVTNAGASGGPEGLNWQFEVNGAYATRGAGAIRLESGDRVLWKLAPYE